MFKRIAQKFKRRPRQEAEEIELQTMSPRLRPASTGDAEPARPYRDYVESEARKYWEETAKEHNLVKPDRRDIREAIIALELWNRSGYSSHGKKPVSQVMQPGFRDKAARAISYRDTIEGDAREYWAQTAREHSLIKPRQKEIRTAAMPILCRALRNRRGNRRHKAVAAMVQYADENRLARKSVSHAYESPSYIDALIKLADEAGWLACEVVLPDHPPPHHPPVYYTIGSGPRGPVPIPREDALIRGDYIHMCEWSNTPVISDYFYPSPQPFARILAHDLLVSGRAYYSLEFMRVRGPLNHRLVNILLQWMDRRTSVQDYGSGRSYSFIALKYLHFSPSPRNR